MIKAAIDLDLSNLEYVRGSGANKAVRIAMNKAMAPVKSTVVGNVPVGSGLLQKAIRIKIKYYKGSNTWAGITGPSTSVKKTVRPKPKKKAKATNRIKKTAKRRKSKAGKLIKKLGKNAKAIKGRVGRFVRKTKAFKAARKRIKKALQPKPRIIRPSSYAHIANWGSKFAQGNQFLEHSLAQSQGNFKATMIESLRKQLAEQFGKAKA